MKKLLIPFLASALLLSGCLDNDDPKPFFYGLATVESSFVGQLEFHSDKNSEGNYFNYRALNNIDPDNKLSDGDRVYMSCTIEKDNMDRTYDATITSCSLNLSKDVQNSPEDPSGLNNVWLDITQGYISTDSRSRLYLNLAINYASTTKNEDKVVAGYFQEDQDEANPQIVVLRIKHYQKEKIVSAANTNDIVSIKLSSVPTTIGGSNAGTTYRLKYMGNGDVEMTKDIKVE